MERGAPAIRRRCTKPLAVTVVTGLWPEQVPRCGMQRALDNRWLKERGVPSLKDQWAQMHYGKLNPKFNPDAVNLTGTA